MKIARIGCALVLVVLALMFLGAGIAAFVPMRFTTTAHGQIEPGRVLRVAFPTSGHLVAIADGGEVERGQVIAALDAAPEEAALASLAEQIELLREQADLERRAMAAGGRQLELDISRAEKRLEHIENQLEMEKGRLAELNLEILRSQQREKSLTAELRRSEEAVLASLIGQGLVTEMEMALSRHRAELAELEAAQLEMEVERTRLGHELRTGELETQQATTEDEIARLKASPPGGRTLIELERRLAELAAEVERMEQSIEAKRIRAPFDGRILAVEAAQDAFVAAGQTVAALADDSEMVFRGSVGQDAIGDVYIGQEARIRLDIYPYLSFGYVQATVQKHETRLAPGNPAVYPITFEIAKAPFLLTPGLTGSADITIYHGTILSYMTRRFTEE